MRSQKRRKRDLVLLKLYAKHSYSEARKMMAHEAGVEVRRIKDRQTSAVAIRKGLAGLKAWFDALPKAEQDKVRAKMTEELS